VNTPTLSRWPLATTLVAALLLGACGGGRHQFCESGQQLTYTDEGEVGYLRSNRSPSTTTRSRPSRGDSMESGAGRGVGGP